MSVASTEDIGDVELGTSFDLLASIGLVGGLVVGLSAWLARDPTRTGGTLAMQWLLVGVVAPLYVIAAGYGSHLRLRYERHDPWLRFVRPISTLLALAAIGLAIFVEIEPGRRYLLVLTAFSIAIHRIREKTQTWLRLIPLAIIVFAAWSFTAAVSFTGLAELFLSAAPSTALMIPAFIIAEITVIAYFSDTTRSPNLVTLRSRLAATAITAAAGICYLIAGLRSDGVLTDFVLYHRDYYVAPAEMVRTGHWLLWDVPSQYGFLSILALAETPARNRWEALSALIAISLTVQALCTLAIFEWERSGVKQRIYAAVICLCIYFGSDGGRFPFGSRLYPQSSLRVVFVVLLITIMFALYRTSHAKLRYRRLLVALGYATCLIGVLWSFETAAWVTVIWVGYLAAATSIEAGSLRSFASRGATHFAIFCALGATSFAVIRLIYQQHLGHGPDWYGFIEFNLLYADDPVYHVAIDRFGPGWLIVLELACIATLAIFAIRARRLRAIPVIVGCWLAVWTTASYYAGEPYSNHVAAIVPVLVAAIAAIVTIIRLEGWHRDCRSVSAALAPAIIILLALAIGSPSTLVKIEAPGLPNYSFDPTQRFPTIDGDLRRIVRSAGIRPGDDVIFSNGFAWTKLANGLLLPFDRSVAGRAVEYTSWLPVSPWGEANMIYSLPYDRVQIYIGRSLEASRRGGWYIAYHEHADCGELSRTLLTTRVVANRNYEAAFCSYVASDDRSVNGRSFSRARLGGAGDRPRG